MNEDYDTIALGTGLKECIVTGLLATTRKEKILQMDRNSYYGGESASLNLEQLYHRFHGPEAKVPESFGRMRDYNIDLCPKFIMACGNLVKVLLASQCVKYLEFRSVSGSFVYKDGEIFKVPATGSEAMMSNLMGFMQKRRFRNFVTYANKYSQSDEKTWDGIDASKTSSAKVFEHFSLDDNTISFTGHALALYQDDEYLKRPALECFDRCNLYAYSLSRYGNSPFIYPLWGLGGLPEGFSRVCAVHGGVYMLNKPVEEILYDENGHVTGVRSEGEVARCKKLIADPSYFIGTDKVRKVGQVARCICILSHPIPNTNDADSCQIIIPGRQIPGRRSDIYMSCTSYHHKVAATGRYIVVISANVETADAHRELIPALALLGKIDKEFFWVSDQYEPTTDGSKDGIFITKSYDATSHFETSTNEVLALFKAMTGVEADLTAAPEEVEEAE